MPSLALLCARPAAQLIQLYSTSLHTLQYMPLPTQHHHHHHHLTFSSVYVILREGTVCMPSSGAQAVANSWASYAPGGGGAQGGGGEGGEVSVGGCFGEAQGGCGVLLACSSWYRATCFCTCAIPQPRPRLLLLLCRQAVQHQTAYGSPTHPPHHHLIPFKPHPPTHRRSPPRSGCSCCPPCRGR